MITIQHPKYDLHMDTEHSTSLQSSPLSSSLCITMLAPAPVYKVTHAHVRGVFISANINLRQHFTHSRTQYLTPAHNTSHPHTIPHTCTQYLTPAHISNLHTWKFISQYSQLLMHHMFSHFYRYHNTHDTGVSQYLHLHSHHNTHNIHCMHHKILTPVHALHILTPLQVSQHS